MVVPEHRLLRLLAEEDADLDISSFMAGYDCGRAVMLAQTRDQPFEIYVRSAGAKHVIAVLEQITWTAAEQMVHDDWSLLSAQRQPEAGS